MFVDGARRGQRIGSAIVRGLEAWASELGYHAAVLETGDRQPEAVRLYEACGYAEIPAYGPYAALPNSICMRRRLAA
jgi:putative acetyltransferase